MATVTLRRSDVFPVGTSVGIFPRNAIVPGRGAQGTAIASAAVDSDGLLTVTNAGIADYTPYAAYAQVGAEHRHLLERSNATNHVDAVKWRARVKARREAIGTTLPGAP